jgi:hypothetical protein
MMVIKPTSKRKPISGRAGTLDENGKMIMAHRKTWETSVNEVVRIFREGLLALIPVVEKAKMPWADPHAYDDWDVIAQGLYEGIVILSLAHSIQWDDFKEIPKFDHRISDYHDRSYIFLAEAGEQKPFICFHSVKAPFDTALVALLDKDGNVVDVSEHDLGNSTFVFSGCRAGSRTNIENITVVL